MSNAQRLYDQTCRHLRAVQANIDRLAELGANEKLALVWASAETQFSRGAGYNGRGARQGGGAHHQLHVYHL